MEFNDSWDKYFIKGTNVLKNKLEINNIEQLKLIERNISLEKLTELYLNPIKGNFDEEHLCKIHKYIFGDIYDFAGIYRTTNMGKTTASFTDYSQIGINLKELLNDIDSKIIKNANSKFLYAEALARCYHRLLEIHPFREGNGRTIREFIREYVEARNSYFDNVYYELDFNSKDIDKTLLFQGTILPDSQLGLLTLQFMNILKEKPIEKEKSIKI